MRTWNEVMQRRAQYLAEADEQRNAIKNFGPKLRRAIVEQMGWPEKLVTVHIDRDVLIVFPFAATVRFFDSEEKEIASICVFGSTVEGQPSSFQMLFGDSVPYDPSLRNLVEALSREVFEQASTTVWRPFAAFAASRARSAKL